MNKKIVLLIVILIVFLILCGCWWYKRNKNISGKNIVDFKIANVFKIDENLKLPKKSRLDQKRSDIFGNLSLNLIDNVDLGYKFS